MDEAYILSTVRGYIDDLQACMDIGLVKPVPFDLSRTLFDNYSYSCWAANEILTRLMNEMSKLPPHISGEMYRTPNEIVEEFIEDMECMYEKTKDENKKYIFSVARYAGEEILSLFSLKGE